MKKICMIVPSFSAKGGITSVVNGYRGSELEKQYRIRYIETYCDGGKVKKLWKAVRAYVVFLWTLTTFRPDLIHIHSSFGASFYRKAPFVYLGSLLRIPIVYHIHGSELNRFYRDASNRKRKMVKSVYGRCGKIIALSNHWKDEFSEFISSDKIEVIENYGITYEEISNGEKKESNSVLFLGFLLQRKGCLDIPEIAAKVRERIPDTRFILAGSGGEKDLRSIMEQANKYDIANCLEFPGWVRGEQKEKLLKNASIFLLPSYTEGMPMSILEAMGYGLPVVSTTVGGIPQLVQHGETGFLCEPGDTEGFARAIVELLESPKKRRQMGLAGAAFVRENYALEKHVDRLSDLYKKLIG